jgi:hypothetical protein
VAIAAADRDIDLATAQRVRGLGDGHRARRASDRVGDDRATDVRMDRHHRGGAVDHARGHRQRRHAAACVERGEPGVHRGRAAHAGAQVQAHALGVGPAGDGRIGQGLAHGAQRHLADALGTHLLQSRERLRDIGRDLRRGDVAKAVERHAANGTAAVDQPFPATFQLFAERAREPDAGDTDARCGCHGSGLLEYRRQPVDQHGELAQRGHGGGGLVGHRHVEHVVDLEHQFGDRERIQLVAGEWRVGIDDVECHAELVVDEMGESG